MLSFNAFVDIAQTADQLLLFVLSPEHRRHLFLQGADDISMDLHMERERCNCCNMYGKTNQITVPGVDEFN